MAKYKSLNDYETYYPTLGVLVQPGEVVDIPEVSAAGLEPVVESKKAKDGDA